MNNVPAATPARKQRPRPERRIKIIEQPTPDSDGWGCIEITVGRQRDTYLVRFIETELAPDAVGFEVEKISADLATVASYSVHIAEEPTLCSCECRGFLRWSRCKHVDGLKTLTAKGKFPRLAK